VQSLDKVLVSGFILGIRQIIFVGFDGGGSGLEP
jgi:hypothetical protein